MNGTSATIQDEWYIREAAGLRLLSALQSEAAGTGPGEYGSWQALRDSYVSQSATLTELRSRAEAQGYLSIRDAAGALAMEIETAFNDAGAAHASGGDVTLNPVAPRDVNAAAPGAAEGFGLSSLAVLAGVVILGILIVRAL